MTSDAKSHPPFHAEHVGSLLRPPALRGAFRAYHAGDLAAEAFHAAQDEAIADAVAMQEAAGLRVCTDGEFRRASYWGHWVAAIDGLGVAKSLFTFHDDSDGDSEQGFIAADCNGLLRKSGPISTDEFRYLASVSRGTVKITLPSPSTLHFWRLDGTIAGTPYATAEQYFADLTDIYRREIAALYGLGCRYIQFDDVPLIMLASPVVRDKVRRLGADPERLVDLYIQALVDALRDCPPDMTSGLHICRGNFKGKWLTEGGYEGTAEKVFGKVPVDAFFLEFDSERSGGFEPLRFIPEGKTVVLGLVSSKTPEPEDTGRLKARIAEAARYVPLERLAISPQCGFASTVAGNPLTADDQAAKLRTVVDVANQTWG